MYQISIIFHQCRTKIVKISSESKQKSSITRRKISEVCACISKVLFGSSLNPVSVEGYRFSAPANAGVVANFRRSFKTFRSMKCDVLVSATNKTPCSANTIGQLLLDASGYRAFVQDYVATLRGLTIPPEEAWLHEPIAAAAALFSEVLAPASTGGVIRE